MEKTIKAWALGEPSVFEEGSLPIFCETEEDAMQLQLESFNPLEQVVPCLIIYELP